MKPPRRDRAALRPGTPSAPSAPSAPRKPSKLGRTRRHVPEQAAQPPAERVYGLSAALALFARRPDAVISIAHSEAVRRPLADLLREAARRHIAYREVDDASLARMAQSVHHEGVCLLVRPLPAISVAEIARRAEAGGLVIALDEVDNPHNIGAIMRSGAYFGATALIVGTGRGAGGRPPDHRKDPVTAAARRVAEGGAELLPRMPTSDLPGTLRELKSLGFRVIGADARASVRVGELAWPGRAVLILGHERNGLASETRAACDTLVRIAGSGAVESLNVSVAAGVLIASFVAAHGPGRAQ